MPVQVSSVSASTVATNCFISSLAGAVPLSWPPPLSVIWPPPPGSRPPSPPPRIAEGSKPKYHPGDHHQDDEEDAAAATGTAADRNAELPPPPPIPRRRCRCGRPRYCHSDDGLSRAWQLPVMQTSSLLRQGRLNPTNNYPNGCTKSQYFSRPRSADMASSALAESAQGL